MTKHQIPLTSIEEDGLRNHRLPIGTPSQLSDCFRQGMAWALSQASHVVELRVEYLPPLQVKVRDILSGIDAMETESPDGWWETTTGADFGKRKLDELLALLGQAVQPVALTADEKAALDRALLRSVKIVDEAAHPVELAALVAERDDALALAASRRADWDSMRQQWVKVRAERDSLRQDAERFRAIRQCRKTVQLYVYEAADDPFSGGWSYKNDPEDFDKFADAAMGEQK